MSAPDHEDGFNDQGHIRDLTAETTRLRRLIGLALEIINGARQADEETMHMLGGAAEVWGEDAVVNPESEHD
jgi:hypothetical protein